MKPKYEKLTIGELKGSEMTLTATEDLLMIHTDTLSCQFPKKTILPMLDETPNHGILRFVDPEYWQMGMTLFVEHKDLVPLVLFLQKHTKSRVVIK